MRFRKIPILAKSENLYPLHRVNKSICLVAYRVIKLAEAAMQDVKNARASNALSCSWLAISREIGAIITMVAAFESSSVRIEVIRYKLLMLKLFE